MRFRIAHRGNLYGPNPERENMPEYIDEAISKGFDVEIDVWLISGQVLLGHDRGEHHINIQFLRERSGSLWCHAKNLEALVFLNKNGFHVFSHDNDDYILTSKGYIWAYPGKPITTDTVCVMPERADYTQDEIRNCVGVCSDFIAQISL
jgi:hypothetical protein